jgi:hypothetical protein
MELRLSTLKYLPEADILLGVADCLPHDRVATLMVISELCSPPDHDPLSL